MGFIFTVISILLSFLFVKGFFSSCVCIRVFSENLLLLLLGFFFSGWGGGGGGSVAVDEFTDMMNKDVNVP